jgi:hypothetical protein
MTFPANSRYHGTATAILTLEDGTEIAYLCPRILPDPARFTLVAEHVVAEGDRLDNIAAVTLGDPELAWRIADSSRAMNPFALTRRVGQRLRITLPEGVGGTVLG